MKAEIDDKKVSHKQDAKERGKYLTFDEVGTLVSNPKATKAVTAWLKTGNKVDFVLMAEAGNIADDKNLRAISGFGFPPITTLLDDPVMNDPANVSWTV